MRPGRHRKRVPAIGTGYVLRPICQLGALHLGHPNGGPFTAIAFISVNAGALVDLVSLYADKAHHLSALVAPGVAYVAKFGKVVVGHVDQRRNIEKGPLTNSKGTSDYRRGQYPIGQGLALRRRNSNRDRCKSSGEQ
jgi:hypothetical protein